MKLYAAPFACSLGVHITLREMKESFQLEWVDLRTKQIRSGGDFYAINPKGKVSTLVLDDGTTLTENMAILQFLVEHYPDRGFAPPAGSMARTKMREWLSFASTEVHKQLLAPYFDPRTPEAMREYVRTELVPKVLAHPERALEDRPYLLGADPTVADVYLFWTTLLLPELGVDFDRYPGLGGFRRRMRQRDAVKEAMAIERQARAAAA